MFADATHVEFNYLLKTSSERLHYDLALKQILIEPKAQQWGMNLVLEKQIFVVGEMGAIPSFLAKRQLCFTEPKERTCPRLADAYLKPNSATEGRRNCQVLQDR